MDANEESGVYYNLKLYVTGASPNSLRAINNITAICDLHLKDRYKLEIIDIYQQPSVAKTAQIIAIPLLIKLSPLPLKRIIGNMSDTQKVLHALELEEIN